MTPITVEIQGAKELDVKLTQLNSLFSNLTSVFEKLSDKFFPLIQRRIDAGIPPPLSPATEAAKARLYGGPSQILIATRALYESFSVGAVGNIRRINAAFAEFGTDIFYAKFHQEGAGRLPQRKIIPDASEFEQEMVDEAETELIGKIRALGFQVG